MINPGIEVLFRANEMATVSNTFRAGADYVLAIPQVSARTVARELRGENVLDPASQIRVVRVPATPFAGETIASAGIPGRTGCRVVAIENEPGLTTRIDPQRDVLEAGAKKPGVKEFSRQWRPRSPRRRPRRPGRRSRAGPRGRPRHPR